MKKIICLGLVALGVLTTTMTDQAEARLFRRSRGCSTCGSYNSAPCNSCQNGCQAPQGMYDPNAPQLDPNAPAPTQAPPPRPAAPQPIAPGNPA